jgi:hypothetical protein
VVVSAPPRGGTVVQQRAPAPESEGQEEEPSAPLVLPRSKAPLVAGALVLLAVLGAAGWYATRSPAVEPAPVPPVKPIAEVVTPEPPPAADAGGEVAEVKPPEEVAEVAPASLGLVDVNGTPLPVRLDDDEAIMLLAKGQRVPFQEGEAVLLVAMPEEGAKKVPYYAHGVVIDAKPTLVKVAFSEGKLPKGLKLYVMREKEGAKPQLLPRKPPAKEPAAEQAREPVVARNEPPAHKQPEAVTRTVNPPPAKEPAHVEPAHVEPAQVDPPPAAVQKAAISGAIGVSFGAPMGQLVRIQNTTALPLSNCTIRLSSNRTGTISYIGANTEIRMRYGDFRPDARAPDPNFSQGWSAVYCREGTGYFFTTFARR